MWKAPDIRALHPTRLALALGGVLLLAGCGGGPAPATFDLSAARDFGRIGGGGQLAVTEPVALQPINSERIIVRQGASVSFVGGGQWSDKLPALVQARLIQTFENGSRIATVGRPSTLANAGAMLASELRAFEIDAARNTAVVEITARIVQASGPVSAARIFRAEVPVSGAIDAANASHALDDALQQVMVQIVRWASGGRR
ncbi:ABC transporter [Camelimonas fluminis]|uniref:ABC-type transport auxiliary lipoprotein family protein n=1 Tax=Camelimonas fluminis TaxID=1576911 RepID=A0ABV7UMI3_9HYPH|nr:ABC-type transport auxiliary lipoprotein family protein [Camelimonas fluminis]GHE56602.1 ABC transporter [Camelimonas fluminis]